jgi:hypothetical protein
MTYVYIQTEPRLWTTGFYNPEGTWYSESDCGDKDDAAARVAWLNGAGTAPDPKHAEAARKWHDAVSPLRDIAEEMGNADSMPPFDILGTIARWRDRITAIVG